MQVIFNEAGCCKPCAMCNLLHEAGNTVPLLDASIFTLSSISLSSHPSSLSSSTQPSASILQQHLRSTSSSSLRPPSPSSPDWRPLLRSAWLVSPRIAVLLALRLPSCATVQAEVAALVQVGGGPPLGGGWVGGAFTWRGGSIARGGNRGVGSTRQVRWR